MTEAKSKLTEAKFRALDAIDKAGSAVIQPRGRVLAAGEFLKNAPETVLALVASGYLEGNGAGRLKLTASGTQALAKFRASRAGRRLVERMAAEQEDGE
jgi:hypothetical protein